MLCNVQKPMQLNLRYIILLTLCLGFFSASAQKKRVKKEKRRYPLTFLSLEYGYQSSQLFINKNYLLYGIWDENIGYRGHSSWNMTGQYGKAFNRNMDLMVGIMHDRQYVIQTKGFSYVPCTPERYGATQILSAERVVKMQRIEVPIDFRYKFYRNNFAFAPTLGVGLAFYNMRNEHVDMFLDNGLVGENIVNDTYMHQSRGLNLTTILKLGFIYEVSSKLALKIEPYYKHYTIKEPILAGYKKVNPYGAGVMIGFEQTLDMAAKKEKKTKGKGKKK